MQKKVYTPIKRFRLPKRQKKQKSPIFKINGLIALLAVFFLVGNIILINSGAASNYKIRKMEKELKDLENNNQNLSLDLSSQQSIDEMMQVANELGFVEAENVKYITVQNLAVAKK